MVWFWDPLLRKGVAPCERILLRARQKENKRVAVNWRAAKASRVNNRPLSLSQMRSVLPACYNFNGFLAYIGPCQSLCAALLLLSVSI